MARIVAYSAAHFAEASQLEPEYDQYGIERLYTRTGGPRLSFLRPRPGGPTGQTRLVVEKTPAGLKADRPHEWASSV